MTKVNSEQAPEYIYKDRKSGQDIIERALHILHDRLIMPEHHITDPQDARDYAVLKLAERKNECFGVYWLDNRHGVIQFEELFQGTIDGASVWPRVVVQRALEVNAAAAIFVHNHPSGHAEPSPADQRITERLRDALKLVDVRLLDHLIVGGTDCLSMAEKGLI